MSKVKPGPRATPQQAYSANIEAINLLAKIERLNLPRAADYIRRNPPTAEAIASLAFILLRVHKTAAARHAGKSPRPNSLRYKIRKAGYKKYAEAKDDPQLKDFSKKQLMDAITKTKPKAKRKK